MNETKEGKKEKSEINEINEKMKEILKENDKTGKATEN